MTLDRCSTNGASGTFVDEQCGARASATERTAYSCSSRSLRRAGQGRGQGQVVRVVTGTADRAGQHAGGDQALLAAGRAARAWRRRGRRRRRPTCCRSARRAAAAATGRRSAPGASTTRSRARTTLSRSPAAIRATAAATAPDQSAPERAPSAKATSVGARREPPAAPGRREEAADRRPRWWSATTSARAGRPRTSGTTSAAPLGESAAKEKDPNATGPVPGRSTSSRTTACADHVAPPALGLARTGRAPCASKRQRAPPADQPLAAADPGHEVGGRHAREQRQQGPRVVDRHGAGHQRRGQAGGRGGRGRDRARTSRPASLRRSPRVARKPLPTRPSPPGDRCRPARRRHQGG